MAENTLEIILQATDNATATISNVKTSLDGVQRSTEDLSKKTTTAGKNITQQFKEASSAVRDLRKTMFIATAAFAVVVASIKEASKYSAEAKRQYDEFTLSVQSFSVMIGTAMAPALENVTYIVQSLTDFVELAMAGFIKLGTFIGEFFGRLGTEGPVAAYRNAIAEADTETEAFLGRIEVAKGRLSLGLTFDKEKKNMKELGETADRAKQLIIEGWKAIGGELATLAGALAGASEMGKGWAKAAVAMSLASAVTNTAVGVTDRLANREQFPWPIPLALAGIVAASGAIQVATIAATKFATGGIVTSPTLGLVGEAGPEAIIPLSRMGSMGMGGHNIHIEINYPTIRSTEDIDALTEEISTRLAREADRL